MRRIIYTADDEEPDCARCDHVCDSDNLCMAYGGPEHGWARYERTELVNCIMLELILRKYSQKYRKWVKRNKKRK